MSTKTTIKRIALVAVSALGLGMVSIVPSNALNTTDASLHSLAFAAGGTTASASIATAETATVLAKTSFVAAGVNDSVTVKAVLVDAPATALGTTIKLSAYDSATSAGIAIWSANPAQVSGSTGLTFGASDNGATAVGTVAVSLYNPTVAGTYTIRIVDYYKSTAGADTAWSPAITPLTFTVTVTAPSKLAGANSTAYIRAGEETYASGTALTDSAVVTAKTSALDATDSVAEATIYVFQRNATSTADESMTVTVDGPAWVSQTSTRPTSGTAITVGNVGGNAPAAGSPIYVWSNGTAGKATITVKSLSGQLIGTKSVYFYGAVTALANATDPKPKTVVRSGGKKLSGAWDISATDAAGMPRPGLTLSCVSSNTLVIASCDFTDNGDGSYTMDLNSASGSTSGQTATITARVVDPAVTTSTAYLSAAAVTVTTGSSVNTVTITTDKSSYVAGEQMIITVTAKDSSGNAVYDGAAVPTLSSNKSVTGLTNVASTFTSGSADSISRDTDGTVLTTYRAYAPASGGEFTIYADYVNASLATVRAEVTATVTDSSTDAANAANDAAQDATEAANAATDAANAAAEAADAATAAAQDAQAAVADLAAQVATLIAGIKSQITRLTNLVIKIQKKVNA